MADQLQTTEGQLYDQVFPSRDLAYWLGKVLQAPVQDIPTREDLLREQGQIGLPTADQVARGSGQEALDYVTTFLGPLMALMTSQQYARQKSGRPAPSWKEQEPYSRANSPLEQLEEWQRSKPWQTRPPEGESAWKYRDPPTIGGPTGRGMTKDEILAAIETERFQGLLKQIRDLEGQEAGQPSLLLPPRAPVRVRGSDDDLLEAALAQLKRQGRLELPSRSPEAFPLPPLPGD